MLAFTSGEVKYDAITPFRLSAYVDGVVNQIQPAQRANFGGARLLAYGKTAREAPARRGPGERDAGETRATRVAGQMAGPDEGSVTDELKVILGERIVFRLANRRVFIDVGDAVNNAVLHCDAFTVFTAVANASWVAINPLERNTVSHDTNIKDGFVEVIDTGPAFRPHQRRLAVGIGVEVQTDIKAARCFAPSGFELIVEIAGFGRRSGCRSRVRRKRCANVQREDNFVEHQLFVGTPNLYELR